MDPNQKYVDAINERCNDQDKRFDNLGLIIFAALCSLISYMGAFIIFGNKDFRS